MSGPFAAEYWQAACVEVETLEEMDAWEVVDKEEGMKILPSTWAFKCKQFPDGLIKNFKAVFALAVISKSRMWIILKLLHQLFSG